jgi:hypothetical protein
MKDETRRQRSEFQFSLYKLNISAIGGAIAIAISEPKWDSILLACPLISATLFLLWFHYGISIADGSRDRTEAQETPSRAIKRTRRYSFAAALLTNFIVAPLAAVSLYFMPCVPVTLLILGGALLAVCACLFVVWYRVEYKRMWRGEEPANKSVQSDSG